MTLACNVKVNDEGMEVKSSGSNFTSPHIIVNMGDKVILRKEQ